MTAVLARFVLAFRSIEYGLVAVMLMMPLCLYGADVAFGVPTAAVSAKGFLGGYLAVILAWLFVAKLQPHEGVNFGWFVAGACGAEIFALFQLYLLSPSHLISIPGGALLLFYNIERP